MKPPSSLTLGRARLAVQIAMFAITVYGANLVGYYMAEKLSSALPALSCAYDQQNGAYCVLVPTQHIVDHRIGAAIAQAKQITLQMLLPLLFTVLSFFAFFFVLNKAFCGWICPLGTIQDVVYRIGRRFGRPMHRLDERRLGRVRPIKWVILASLVLAFPLLTGLGVLPHSFGNPYCDVCPSRILTTLLTGDTEQLGLRTSDAVPFALGAIANTLAGFVLIGALAVRQPFCRICPLLAFNAAFQRLSPMRLVKQPHDKCEKCGICTRACPMDIVEISKEHGPRAFHEDCTLCGRCAEYCPDDGVIQIKWGPLALFRSRRDYYRARIRQESPEGQPKQAAARRSRDEAPCHE